MPISAKARSASTSSIRRARGEGAAARAACA
jgi:hypothetical protein